MARTPLALLVALPLLLVACATPYRPQGDSDFGYSETWLAPDDVEVYFDGNSDTPSEHASDYALLRCAEVALEQGYTHFLVLERLSDLQTSYTSTPAAYSSVGTGYYGYHSGHAVVVGGDIRSYHQPHSRVRIRLLREPSDGALEAAFVSTSIRAKYGMP
jgi:hypothetical protein